MFDRMNPDMKGLSGPLRRLREGNVSDNNEPADLLATLLMAGGLPETAVAPIRSLDCRLMEADRRRAFRPEGHSANEFVVVLSGMLAKFRTDRAGSRQIIGVSLPHDVILPHNGIRLYGLQALVKSRLILVPKQSLDRAVRHSDDLRQYLWRAILRDEAINHERILNLARRDAASRVAHLFCEFRERGGLAEPNAGLPLTQQQIASITGQTPINVNRIMRDFQRAGYLTRERSRVSILDWSGLEQVASFNPLYLRQENLTRAA